MIKVDFHVHTSASDGILSPTDVVKRGKINEVKFLAITDHDTLTGIDEAISEGLKENICIIPGIELSTQYNDESVHVLGFFKGDSFRNPELTGELNKIKNHRIIRAEKMVKKLKDEFNISLNFEDILKKSRDTVARPHIARAIMDAGYNYSHDYIFNNFIGKGCKAYVPTLKLSTEEGVKLLKKHNALAFLAHPKLIKNSSVNDFLNMNFDGIEAFYFQNTDSETKYYVNVAEENNMLISCGSDFHGDIINDKRHGDVGCMSFSDKYLKNLLTALDISYNI
ncbi:PHP domain-containing protein [uncultured Clostridium sp.]|uniref:PHP domain-containing protein n=1 Tax=uncultured Clostridium sp. TaxID=59620 RepID=UPI0025CF3967|nr:PHP domain-containing protein [uncultured Clostridium sp.]